MSAPTLFVGLGGTGAKIVSMLEKQNRNSTQMLGYAIFDTDANELRDIRERGYKGALIQTAENLTVGEYLDVDTEAANRWFPVNRIVNRKTLTEGAGQVRAISRLAFDATVRSGGMDPLHREIEKLYQINSDDLEQSLRVVIVSSVAGGTGSGLVLPVAMYIRKYLAATFEQYSSIIRGFFMMPEVFDKVNSDQAERNSLAANAYATLKELDAFMRKGDGFLEERYEKRLVFPIPRAGSDEYDYTDAMPYDFCFLFDKRTSTNSVLESFEDYKQQAVTCLQGLCIELTSKRNNSSEDNVIKELVEARSEGSCKRYCGIGAAGLVYPYEDIVAYIAEYWKEESLNTTWLKYDLEFEKQKKERKLQEEALSEVDRDELTRGKSYVGSIQQETSNDILGDYIRKQCDYRPGSTDHIGNWFDYHEALETSIESFYEEIRNIAQVKTEYTERLSAVLQAANKNTMQGLEDAAVGFEKAEQYLFENARKLFYRLAYDETDNPECVWHWVKSPSQNEGGFHPNSVRFFLYNVLKVLDDALAEQDDAISHFDTYINSDEYEHGLDLDKTKKIKETRETIAQYVDVAKNKEGVRQQMHDFYNTLFKEIDSKYKAMLKKRIYEMIRDFLQKLSDNYEDYYDGLSTEVGKNEAIREDIQKKLSRRSGNTLRLVSCSPKCLEEIKKKTAKNSRSTEVPAALCDDIYKRLHAYTVESVIETDERKLKAKRRQIIQSTVNDFWLDYVRKSISGQLDVNVIQAIMNEAEWEKEIYDQEGKLTYLRSVLKEMHQLSVPFLTKTTGGEKRVIASCSYNVEIIENSGDSQRRILQAELTDKGGESSRDSDRHKITFTQSVYGLSLNEIGKFAPVKTSYVYGKVEGSYYSAYSEVIRHIHPNMTKTCYLTPHLDRNWHYINILPEINEDEQKRIEEEICCAMIYGLVFKRFVYEQRSQFAKVYKYRLNFRGSDKEEELYSNDELCDNFHELLTALIKNHMTVEDILAYSHERIANGVDAVRRLEDSYLMTSLRAFRLDELDHETARAAEKDKEETSAAGTVRSIFEIPLIYARTAPMKEYDETYANTMITAAFKVMRETVDQYLQGDDANFRLCELIFDQYKLYLKNLKELKKIWKGIDKQTIDSQIRISICEKVESLGNPEMADRIRDSIKDPKYLQSLEETGA